MSYRLIQGDVLEVTQKEPYELPDKIEKGLRQIEKLDIKQGEFLRQARDIQSTSPMNQAPPILERVLDKGIVVGERKAEIWNEIRNYIVKDFKTLWQIAVNQNLPVHSSGKEGMLNVTAEDLRNAIEAWIQQQAPPVGQAPMFAEAK